MLIVDTSVWIDFLRGEKTKACETLRELINSEEEIYITEIILTEILQGIKDDKLYNLIKEYLLYFPVLKPKGIETYIRASEIFRNCRKQGNTVRKTIDCIIASIAIENRATIIHKDHDYETIREFSELKTINMGNFC
ncbi:PIN domain nuclease [Candidatus Aerophobetes bacterium]|nr:PIN domain nuclease [Candidatus Aerophobetes bacterium]